MFGNDFIDFCNLNYENLVKLSQGGLDELTRQYLSDYAKVFINFYGSLQTNKEVKIAEFIASGIDFQRLCLLVFLVFLKEGNRSISMNRETIIYMN